METTKKTAVVRKAAWNEAIDDGRLVRFEHGAYFKACNTVYEAERAVEHARGAGLHAEIVRRS